MLLFLFLLLQMQVFRKIHIGSVSFGLESTNEVHGGISNILVLINVTELCVRENI